MFVLLYIQSFTTVTGACEEFFCLLSSGFLYYRNVDAHNCQEGIEANEIPLGVGRTQIIDIHGLYVTMLTT